jgi:hypothetical protein
VLKVKNEWSYTATNLVCPKDMYSDNFNLTLPLRLLHCMSRIQAIEEVCVPFRDFAGKKAFQQTVLDSVILAGTI